MNRLLVGMIIGIILMDMWDELSMIKRRINRLEARPIPVFDAN